MLNDSIITEVINNHLRRKGMLKEYKNPMDSETIRVCGDQLEQLYKNVIANGASKNEYTVQQLLKVVNELRKLQEMFK